MLRHRSPDHGNTAVKDRDTSPAEAPVPLAHEPRSVGDDDWLIDDTEVVWATPPAAETNPIAVPSTVDTSRTKREYT